LKYLDWNGLFEFMSANCGRMQQNQPTKKRMVGMLRRIQCNLNSKITFQDFCKIIKPICIVNKIAGDEMKQERHRQIQQEEEKLIE